MATEKVNIIVSLKDKASKSLGAIEKRFKSIGTTTKVVAIAALAALTVVINKTTKAFNKQAIILKQTEAVLKSTGNAAGLTAQEVNGMAKELAQVTTLGDEAIQMGQNMLLTFTNIGKDVFPKATETMLDMATAMNGGVTPSAEQLRTTAIQLGKALNDPTVGATALRRVGVALTEQQLKQIKAFQKSGDIMSAQKIILKELSTEFGGAARAQGETFAGSLAKLNNAFGDLQETIGSFIAGDAGKGFIDFLTKAVRGADQLTKAVSSSASLGMVQAQEELARVTEQLALLEEKQLEVEESGGLSRLFVDYSKNIEIATTRIASLKERLVELESTNKGVSKNILKDQKSLVTKLADFWKQFGDDMSKSLSFLESGMRSTNKTIFDIGKAAGIANATIKGVEAVQTALASAPPPFNFALAGAVGAVAADNVSKIASTQVALAEGGSMLVDQPTRIGNNVIAGEAGTERIDVTPTDEGGGANSGNVTVNIDGRAMSRDLYEITTDMINTGEIAER